MKDNQFDQNECDIDDIAQCPEYVDLKQKILLLDHKYHQLDEEYDSYLKQISEIRKRRKLSANTECDGKY